MVETLHLVSCGVNDIIAKYLFSGLTKCACCRGGYSMISTDLVGCSTARNKGTCDNRTNIRRDRLEERVLNALRHHLMDPALFKEFCDDFTREMNRLQMQARTSIEAATQTDRPGTGQADEAHPGIGR